MNNAAKNYATTGDDGVNYRDIANTMSILGYTMNHSSARNNILRVMKKFVVKFAEQWNVELSDEEIDEIARSPLFQGGIADKLHNMWAGSDGEALFTQKG